MQRWPAELSRGQERSAGHSEDRRTIEDILGRSFVTAHLLTGNITQAETAVLGAIDLWNPHDASQLFQTALNAAVQSRTTVSPSDSSEQGTAGSYLPFELRRVLRLAPMVRRCFVLRVLVGLPSEVCAQMLDLDIQGVDQHSATASADLSAVDPLGRGRLSERSNEFPSVGNTTSPKCHSRGEQKHMVEHKEVEHLAYRLWQERGSPIGSPAEDWFRAEAELRRERPMSELRVFSFAMGPIEQ